MPKSKRGSDDTVTCSKRQKIFRDSDTDTDSVTLTVTATTAVCPTTMTTGTESVKNTDPKTKPDTGASHLKNNFLEGVHAYILIAGIGKVRCELFKKQLKAHGGEYCEQFSPENTTHIVVDEKMTVDRLCRIMKIGSPPDPNDCKIVKSVWLSACLKQKDVIDPAEYQLDVSKYLPKTTEKDETDSHDRPTSIANPLTKTDSKAAGDIADGNPQVPTTSLACDVDKIDGDGDVPEQKFPKTGIMYHSHKPKAARLDSDSSDPDSDYVKSGDEDNQQDPEGAPEEEDDMPKRPLPKGSWVCAHSSGVKRENHNKHITDKLEALARTYESTNDTWRALGYQKAITVLKKHPKAISSFEEARSLRGVGDRLAEKIWEITESGELQKLNELNSSEEIQALNLFTDIWGAGAHTARTWVAQGFRTLDDIRTKANLTRHQTIGLKHYDEFLDRMPRDEATEIECVVVKAALSLQPGLVAMACGSYRRGKTTCGDVDVLVTHPDGKSHLGIFSKLLNKLRLEGFITDDLVTQEDNHNQKKYLGVCRLPGENRKHRRLDIIVVPYDEFGCALMYFTGSAHFNRSMRNLAGKMGMSLNEHGLFTGVVRKGSEKLNKGVPLHCPTEESVFKHLGLKYRSPEERDH